jgi:hypothetical protein
MATYRDPNNLKKFWKAKDATDLAEQMRVEDWRIPQAKDVPEFLVRSADSARMLGKTVRSDTPEHWLEDLIKNGMLEMVPD